MGLLSFPVTGIEFVGESFDFCFEGLKPLSLLFERCLNFVDTLAQQSGWTLTVSREYNFPYQC